RCRMYDGGRALVDGYAKSLWVAFGSPADAVAVAAILVFLGVVPWLLLGFTWWAAPAAAAGVLSRLVAALRAGNRPVVDCIAHPLSVLAFTFVVFVSVFRHARGRLTWKGRSLP
ncbi:MAG TPA: glycosyl transferase, partial [Mycobacteriales bacterium]|nr:glycosyl transferase [Mycobacteriales bacterium]